MNGYGQTIRFSDEFALKADARGFIARDLGYGIARMASPECNSAYPLADYTDLTITMWLTEIADQAFDGLLEGEIISALLVNGCTIENAHKFRAVVESGHENEVEVRLSPALTSIALGGAS